MHTRMITLLDGHIAVVAWEDNSPDAEIQVSPIFTRSHHEHTRAQAISQAEAFLPDHIVRIDVVVG